MQGVVGLFGVAGSGAHHAEGSRRVVADEAPPSRYGGRMTMIRAALLAVLSLPACALPPSSIPGGTNLVVVKSVQLPDREWLPWYTQFADHCWVDFRDASGWWRVEWNQHNPDVQMFSIVDGLARSNERWEMCVQVHAIEVGDAAKQIAANIRQRAREFPFRDQYRAFPGPNSNTFVDWLARTCGLHVQLPTTALGKNYASTVRAGLTTAGTGVALNTFVFGLEVGLQEGATVELFGLPFGVGLVPPALKLPLLPAIPLGFFGRGSAEQSNEGDAAGGRPHRLPDTGTR